MRAYSPHIQNSYFGSNSYTDFIFSVSVKKEIAEAKAFSINFGVNETKYQFATFDFERGRVYFGDESHPEIKSAEYVFAEGNEYKIDLVVNDGVAKIYINQGDTAILLYRLPSYEAGKVGHDLAENHFTYHDESLLNLETLSGDYFVAGYKVSKIVNLTDDNTTLTTAQYSVEGGVVRIDSDYLNTLEVNTEYKFRAITSFTDFDFYVVTDETGVEIAPQLSKYYRGNDVSFELSEPSRVEKVLVDGEAYAFNENEEQSLVTLTAATLENLPSGDHTVKMFTENGRPEARFSLYSTVEIIPEVPAKSNHTYFFIDIAIFAVLIAGYVTFSLISKRKKKQ